MDRIKHTHNSRHFKNHQSSLDNHQSLAGKRGDCPRVIWGCWAVRPNPVAYAHRQRCAALRAKTGAGFRL